MAKGNEKAKSFQSPRGTHDILPADEVLWEKVRDSMRAISVFYGFERIETPHFEDTDLFVAGVGRNTDIVAKEMYSFKTRGGDALTLRPEGTAPVARAYAEHGMMNLPQPVKLYYLDSFFRHDKPQRGRYREFHQWGLEVMGDESPVSDAEVIRVFTLLLEDWNLKDYIIEVNSIGCPVCRSPYRAQLTAYYRSRLRGLCRDCRERFRENPLRLLDCKEERCAIIRKSAPQLLDKLCESCRNHFRLLLEFLEEMKIPYALNPHLVRGLDYYTKTVFEGFLEEPAKAIAATPEPVGGDNAASVDGGAATPAAAGDGEGPPPSAKRLAVFGGGRYDNLIELVGGKPTPACGGALGIERFVGIIRDRGKVPVVPKPKTFFVQLGELAKKKGFRLMEDLRHAGISMAESLGRDSIRSQLKVADRVGAPFALILGQKEALDGTVILREMSSGMQETIPQDKLVETLRRKLKH